MCNTCAGQIILRTADGFEKVVRVPNCDIETYLTAFLMPGALAVVLEPSALPEDTVSGRREYRWRGDSRDGVRILEEVVTTVERARPTRRSIEVLDLLNIETSSFD